MQRGIDISFLIRLPHDRLQRCALALGRDKKAVFIVPLVQDSLHIRQQDGARVYEQLHFFDQLPAGDRVTGFALIQSFPCGRAVFPVKELPCGRAGLQPFQIDHFSVLLPLSFTDRSLPIFMLAGMRCCCKIPRGKNPASAPGALPVARGGKASPAALPGPLLQTRC